MKFDTVIIGGGLAGLTATISLAQKGVSVALVSTGYSALHFNSGSLGLLSYSGSHKPAVNIEAAIGKLPETHPYARLGANNILELAGHAKDLLTAAGVKMHGEANKIHERISPLGVLAPAWLTVDGIATKNVLDRQQAKKIAIVGIDGYLDFFPRFIAATLEKNGIECDIRSISTDELRQIRESESEMRAPNISRVLTGNSINKLADALNECVLPGDADAILFPAVVGSESADDFNLLRELVDTPLYYCATSGASVPGIMLHRQLLNLYSQLGGTYFKGDSATGACLKDNRVEYITTRNLGDDKLVADNFIFASGSFFSHGLQALPDRIIEPVIGLDIDAPADRTQWFDNDMFSPQPYMKAGISTDRQFRAIRRGNTITNLYVAGSALSGADSLREGSGAGVAMLTALNVANTITSLSN